MAPRAVDLTRWLYQNPLETRKDFQGPVSTEELVGLMIDDRLSDTTWVKRMDNGATGFAGSFPEVAQALLQSIDRLVPRRAGRRIKPPHWARGWFQSIAAELPVVAWPVILALVQRARSDEDLEWVGARPLETLLSHHGPSILDRLESETGANPKLRKALSGVCRNNIPDGVWGRVERLLANTPSSS
jgi:hypothetical protein